MTEPVISDDLVDLLKPIEDLRFDDKNTQKHNRRSIEDKKASLSSFGQQKPIVISRDDNTVIAGNGILEAAIELGWDKIAAVYFNGSASEAKAFGIVDNRSSHHAEWNSENLFKAVQDVSDFFSAEDLGFVEDELQTMFLVEHNKEPAESSGEQEEKPPRMVTCPSCDHSFNPKGKKDDR